MKPRAIGPLAGEVMGLRADPTGEVMTLRAGEPLAGEIMSLLGI